MAKFAKLYDVADTQVLFMLASDDDGNTVLKMTTEIDGMEVSQCMTLKHKDEDEAEAMYQKAADILAALDQSSADRFHAQMVGLVGESMDEANAAMQSEQAGGAA